VKRGTPVLLKAGLVSACGMILLAAALLLGVSFGSSGLKGWQELSGLLDGTLEQSTRTILVEIRLPRVLLAALAGAGLSLGGLVFQTLLRNPLAEPYILGVSGGAAVGAIIGLLIGFSGAAGMGGFAFAGSLATLGLVLLLASGHGLRKDTLLLAGVMVNAFCSALILFFLSISQEAGLRSILFWLMGDLSMAYLGDAAGLGIALTPCFLVLLGLAHQLNLLLLGRESAHSLGVRVEAVTTVLLVITSLMIGLIVARAGLMGFVGLVIPHLMRLLLGPDHRVLIPACLLGGGAYLVLCDLLARALPAQGEMPVGVVTALIGAPLFILLLRRSAVK
jgi:iron complex transport system permease protein